MSRRNALILASGMLLATVVVGYVALRLPSVPYNVRELAERQATLTLFTLGSLAQGTGLFAVGSAKLWQWRPTLFVKWFVPGTVAIAGVVFLTIWVVVPEESLDDLVGSPVLGIGAVWERWLRFVGLFVGPLAALTLGARLAAGDYRPPTFWLGIGMLLTIILASFVVVVPLAATDNIVELLRGDGNVWALVGGSGYFVLLGSVVALLSRSPAWIVERHPIRIAVAVVALAVSIPVAWQLFVLASHPNVEKYGEVFSARQFLLSPDRDHYLDDGQIFMRFALLQLATSCLLATGGVVAHSLARNDDRLCSTSSARAGIKARRRPSLAQHARGREGTEHHTDRAKQIEGLDGLRALACLAVFGVHFQQITGVAELGPLHVKQLLENGNIGVSLFFTLSGFLLSFAFWQRDFFSPDRRWLGRYVSSRVVRIIPAYYLCLTGLVIVQSSWTSSDKMSGALAHYLFVHNFSEAFFYGISPPFWTIAAQAQFYGMLPLLFWLFDRVAKREATRVMSILALSVACYVLHCFFMELGDQMGAQFGIPDLVTARPTVFGKSVLAHMPHLLWGVLAARVYLELLASQPTWRRSAGCEAIVWLAALAVLAILATPLDFVFQVPHGRYNWPFVPMLIAAIITCVPMTSAARWLLEVLPLRKLGTISYGVYIYHLPCMKLVAREFPRLGISAKENWLLYGAISLAASVVIATISFTLIERPLLQLVRGRSN